MVVRTKCKLSSLKSSKSGSFYPEDVLACYSRAHGVTRESAVGTINDARKRKAISEAYPEGSFQTLEKRKLVIPTRIESERINLILNSKSRTLAELKDETGLSDSTLQETMERIKKKGFDLRQERKRLLKSRK